MTPPLKIEIDRNSPVPLYHQVKVGIEDAIRSGTLTPGMKLPNEVDLANSLNLSRPTMRKAMDDLVRSGLLVRKRGVGTQVVASQVKRSLELSSLNEDLLAAGKSPTTSVVTFDLVSPDSVPQDVRDRLQLAPEAGAYTMTRIRSVAGEPLALMTNWVRDDICTLSESQLKTQGLYEVLRTAGVNFRLATQTIGAVNASEENANHLACNTGDALVSMDRVASDDNGQPVELGHHLYRADHYTFEMTLVQS